MEKYFRIIFLLSIVIFTGFSRPYSSGRFVIAMHCIVDSEKKARSLAGEIDRLSVKGVNMIIADVGYSYMWESHKELRAPGAVTHETASEIGRLCRRNGIRLIPEIPCIGHQSWEGETDVLLMKYPQFDETPGKYPGNEGIYCRSWCTRNRDVYPIVFDLIDEITEAFITEDIHVGLDEVFLIGEDSCRLCKGRDKSRLFADAVKKLHTHIVSKRNMTMYMWGDRLINGRNPETYYNGSEYETSMNDTYRAVDIIPRDIVICDWHYDEFEKYGSVPFFLRKGFRVLTASYNNRHAAERFIRYSLQFADKPGMLGHIYTNWGDTDNSHLHNWPPFAGTVNLLKNYHENEEKQ